MPDNDAFPATNRLKSGEELAGQGLGLPGLGGHRLVCLEGLVGSQRLVVVVAPHRVEAQPARLCNHLQQPGPLPGRTPTGATMHLSPLCLAKSCGTPGSRFPFQALPVKKLPSF